MRLLLFFLNLSVFSFSGSAQYDEWTFVRTLPESEIDDFEPMSETEILTLSNGIIYYSDDLGSTWSLFKEYEDDPINSLKSDAEGSYYYKNRSGLYKGQLDDVSTKISTDLESYKIQALKGDTILMSKSELLVGETDEVYYSIDGGLSWQNIELVLEWLRDVDIDEDYFYITDRNEIYRYNPELDEYKIIKPEFPIEYFDSQMSVLSDGSIYMSTFSLDANFSNVNYFVSHDQGDSFENIKPDGLSSFVELPISSKNNGDVFKVDNKKTTASPLVAIDFYYSDDFGYTWKKVNIDSMENQIGLEIFQNEKNPHVFVLIEDGRLYRTSSSTSSKDIKNIKSEISVAPNPARESISLINNKVTAIYEVKIYSAADGQMVLKADNVTSSESLSINIENLKTGLHYIEVIYQNKDKSLTRFIKL